MRFVAPAREAVDRAAFAHPAFAGMQRHLDLLCADAWPSVDALDARLGAPPHPHAGVALRLRAQTPALLADGLHYETRILRDGIVATRECNWHDLLNALMWCEQRALKGAMNRRQACDVAAVGGAQRTRGQCALTHFDEAGAILLLRDGARIEAWDQHDWDRLFCGLEPDAHAVVLVGHALLEHALDPGRLPVAKALAVHAGDLSPARVADAVDAIALRIAGGTLLADPQDLRPLPLMGLPGWHAGSGDPAFHRDAACFRPLREGRRYPQALDQACMARPGRAAHGSLLATCA